MLYYFHNQPDGRLSERRQYRTVLMHFFLIFTFLIMLLLNGCGTTKQSVTPSVTEKTETATGSSEQSKQSIKNIDDQLFQDALSALKLGETEKAKSLFSQFIDQHPELSGAYLNLALIHFKESQIEKALELTNKAIDLNSEQPQAYQLRAQINIKNGKIKDAKEDYLKAIELNPDYINAQYNLALLYDIYLQDIKSAIKHYEAYMSLLDKPDEVTRDWINHLKGTL